MIHLSFKRFSCSRCRKVPFIILTVLLVTLIAAIKFYLSLRKPVLVKVTTTLDKMVFQTEEQATQNVWRNTDAVCFDVDSTVIMEEGLDELADFMGKGREIAALTNQAMGGSMTFRDALEMRLKLLQPSIKDVRRYLLEGSMRLTPGVMDLVDKLHEKGADVYLVSGGFTHLIFPVADVLGIPRKNVFANELLFDSHGQYASFNKGCYTSASGGKARVAQHLKDTQGYQNMVFIGDGATDLEACPPADAFIGFGGNQEREKVKKGAKWFVKDFDILIDSL